MRGTNVDELQLLVTAANDWRNSALPFGVHVNQINSTFPDGSNVILAWNVEASEWDVLSTAGNQ